jgi:anthranilate synthase component 1
MFFPSQKEFVALTKKGNLIPVYREIPGDLDTPVSAYFKTAQDAKYSFLLESVEGEAKVARFSFLAKDPEMIIQSKDDRLTITRVSGSGKTTATEHAITGTPLNFIRDIFKKYKFVPTGDLPRFCGGLVGFMSYDIARHFELLPAKTVDDLKLPDMLMVLAKALIIFDHLNHKIKIVECVEVDPESPVRAKAAAYQQACGRITKRVAELNQGRVLFKNKPGRRVKKPIQSTFCSNFTKPEFVKIVNEAKKQIRAGEIIQVVLSQRLSVKLRNDPIHVYRALRGLNPSPYMYFLKFDGIHIIGSSPELLVRCENGVVETRPIAGTRPRGRTDKEDQSLARELLNDPKEKAEHIMLVDLGRNDLGRVCQKGSVRVSEFMGIEKYSHVMHIISNVKGKLKPRNDSLDVLQAAFPAGTLSGAPKIRAMEIIEDLEKQRRGPYGGCICYLSFSGNLDSCITIRTIVAANGYAHVQAGAGIVADSKPENEYQETLNKARAQLLAVELAENKI